MNNLKAKNKYNFRTRLKLRIRKWSDVLNKFISNRIPINDLRANPQLLKNFNSQTLFPESFICEPTKYYHYNLDYKPYWYDMYSNGFTMHEIYYIQFSSAHLLGLGIIIDDKKKLLLESAFFQKEYLYKLRKGRFLLKNYLKAPTVQFNNVIPLMNRLSNNYFHWTVENLTRIILLIEHDNTVREKYSLIVWEKSPAAVFDSLRILAKWPENKIIKWKENDAAKVQDCIFVSYPAERNKETLNAYAYLPQMFRTLNRIALTSTQDEKKLPQYFIVSRSNANARNLINENEVAATFNDLLFEIVHLEKMNFKEQLQLFKNAKIIIAPHGAGITNILYCDKDVLLIELFPRGRNFNQTSSFHQISKALSIEHYIIMTSVINENEDMIADDSVIKQIKEIFEEHKIVQTN